MSLDGAIWDLMREHADDGGPDRRAGEPEPDRDRGPYGETTGNGGGRDAASSDARRDATVRVLDAAVGVVGSTRYLLAVIEDVLREQRDRVAAGAGTQSPAARPHPSGRERIDLTY